jgi:hypothetical protein
VNLHPHAKESGTRGDPLKHLFPKCVLRIINVPLKRRWRGESVIQKAQSKMVSSAALNPYVRYEFAKGIWYTGSPKLI